MYKCEVCKEPSAPNQPKRRLVVKRPDGQIEKEMAVCVDCDALLKTGMSHREVWSFRAAPIEATTQAETENFI